MTRSPQSSTSVIPGKTPPGNVMIFEYGARLDKTCVDAVFEQIWKSRRLYNDIIADIRRVFFEAQRFTIEKAGPEAQALNAEIAVLNEAFAAARTARDEAAMGKIAEDRRGKWKRLSEELKAARQTYKAELRAINSQIGRNRDSTTYRLRCKAVDEYGLGWGTANAILEAALVAYKKSMAGGKPPRFAAHIGPDLDGFETEADFNQGNDTANALTLQFTTPGGLLAETLLNGTATDFQMIAPEGEARRGRYGRFRFRLGAAKAGQFAEGSWQYHRPIPVGARIGLARLIRRRIGKDCKYALQVMVTLPGDLDPEFPLADRKSLVAVHMGWAADVNGRRVAGIADCGDPNRASLVQLPPRIEHALQRASEIQSDRDAERDQIVERLRAEPPDVPPGPAADELAAIRRLPTQYVAISRLHLLCKWLAAEAALPGWLDEWRRDDRLQWQSTSHIARRARNDRRTFYRTLAADLAARYETIAIEPVDLRAAAEKVNPVSGEIGEFNKAARAGRVVAALYEMESAIRWAAVKSGAAVVEVSGMTSGVCAKCGTAIVPDLDDYRMVKCPKCSATADRKLNGAAMAWQKVAEMRETVVEQYWLDRRSAQDDRLRKQREKKDKVIAARATRTANARTDPEGIAG